LLRLVTATGYQMSFGISRVCSGLSRFCVLSGVFGAYG
jgi:hypothetical protein